MNNNKPIIHNLDEKQNPPEYIRLGGIDMDISFIPCGVAIPLTKAYDEWIDFLNKAGGENEIRNNPDKAQESAELIVKVVATFTKFFDKQLNEDWLLKHTDMKNLGFAMTKIIQAISNNVKISNQDTQAVDESKKKEISSGNEQ